MAYQGEAGLLSVKQTTKLAPGRKLLASRGVRQKFSRTGGNSGTAMSTAGITPVVVGFVLHLS
jgi:hypothetical protein